MYYLGKVSSSGDNQLWVLSFDSIENIVSFAYLWLVFKASTHCSKYIITINVSSVCDVVNWDLGMKDNSNLLCPFSIISQYSIVARVPVWPWVSKWILHTINDFLRININSLHNLLGAILCESSSLRTIVYEVKSIVKPFSVVLVNIFFLIKYFIDTSLSQWLFKKCDFSNTCLLLTRSYFR